MRRRLVATLWLLLLATNQAGPLAGWLATQHQCGCDERVCRCSKHHRPAIPNCHFPSGGQPPAFQTCDSDDLQVLASSFYLLPRQVSLAQPVSVAELTPATPPRVPLSFGDISPPPPRTPLSQV